MDWSTVFAPSTIGIIIGGVLGILGILITQSLSSRRNVKLRRREEFVSVVARVLTHAADARLALEAFCVATLRGQASSEGKSAGDYLIDYSSANHKLKIALDECELLMPETAQQATSLREELALGKSPTTVTQNRGDYDAVRTDFIVAARRCLPK